MDITYIIIEIDSLILFRTLVGALTVWSIGSLLGVISTIISSFENCCWSFVKRDCNQVAHKLASWAFSTSTSMMYDLHIYFVAASLVAHEATWN